MMVKIGDSDSGEDWQKLATVAHARMTKIIL